MPDTPISGDHGRDYPGSQGVQREAPFLDFSRVRTGYGL